MRKVTKEAVSAFLGGQKYSKSNTSTDGKNLYLHGNLIARRGSDGIQITNAGWPSNTTKERLNGIPGVSISQKAGVWYLNGNAWNGAWVKIS